VLCFSLPSSWGRFKVHWKIGGEICAYFFHIFESLHAKEKRRLWLGAAWVKAAGSGLVLDALWLAVTAPLLEVSGPAAQQVRRAVWGSQSLPGQHQPNADDKCACISRK